MIRASCSVLSGDWRTVGASHGGHGYDDGDVGPAEAEVGPPKAVETGQVTAPEAAPSGTGRTKAFSGTVVEPPFIPKRSAKTLKAEALSRRDPDAIRRAFETGDYPYKSKVTENALSRAHAAAAGRDS